MGIGNYIRRQLSMGRFMYILTLFIYIAEAITVGIFVLNTCKYRI